MKLRGNLFWVIGVALAVVFISLSANAKKPIRQATSTKLLRQSSARVSTGQDRPNILFIIADDQSPFDLKTYNPKTKLDIEKEMIGKLGQKKIIWLKKGIPQDDYILEGPIYDQIYPKGVKGHMDEFCRFVDASTILISSVSEIEANS